MVIQWVTSPDQPQGSSPSSKNDSHELGSQNPEPDTIVAISRLGSGRRNDLRDLEGFDSPHIADDSPSRASSQRELSTEAMIDGRAAMSISNHNRARSVSTDTLPIARPFDTHIAANPTVFNDKHTDTHDEADVALPEAVRLRGSNPYIFDIWRPNP
jgi:hypothetical protein